VKDDKGEVIEVHCTTIRRARRQCARPAQSEFYHSLGLGRARHRRQVRLYENLLRKRRPEPGRRGKDFTANLNPTRSKSLPRQARPSWPEPRLEAAINSSVGIFLAQTWIRARPAGVQPQRRAERHLGQGEKNKPGRSSCASGRQKGDSQPSRIRFRDRSWSAVAAQSVPAAMAGKRLRLTCRRPATCPLRIDHGLERVPVPADRQASGSSVSLLNERVHAPAGIARRQGGQARSGSTTEKSRASGVRAGSAQDSCRLWSDSSRPSRQKSTGVLGG